MTVGRSCLRVLLNGAGSMLYIYESKISSPSMKIGISENYGKYLIRMWKLKEVEKK